MRNYKRSPDGNVTALDRKVKVEDTLYIPFGTTPGLNGGDDLPGALYLSTNPSDTRVYYKAVTGGAFIAIANLSDLSTKADLINGKIPASQLPSYVDDVLEFANLAALPATGEGGKIYVAIETNLQYRWSGTAYIAIGGGGGGGSFLTLTGLPSENVALASVLAAKQDKLNQLISGCEITPGATTSIALGSWRINGIIYSKATVTTFINITLSAAGLFRTVAFYGNITNGIEKVESAQSAAVAPPSNEIADKALLRYMIVGDATFLNQAVDYEKFALKADVGDKATLTTVAKTTIVAAVNEVKGTLDSQSSDQITLKIFKVSNYGTP